MEQIRLFEDTIVGISTAMGKGAISIVRLSGIDAIEIVNKTFKGKNLSKAKSHTIHYGNIIDNKEIIDEVASWYDSATQTYKVPDDFNDVITSGNYYESVGLTKSSKYYYSRCSTTIFSIKKIFYLYLLQ